MNSPAQPQPKAKPSSGKAPRRHQRHQQPYRRSSAVIDERPDGKPIIFGYGRHLSKREKDRVQRLIAYTVLGVVVTVSVIVIAATAFYNSFIYPNQTVASVNGHGISRHDRDTVAQYSTAMAAAQGQQASADPTGNAAALLQKQELTSIEAKSTLGLSLGDADITTALNKVMASSGGQGSLDRLLKLTGIGKSDYLRLIFGPSVLRTKIGEHLTRNNPKTADQWHYARIQLKTETAARDILRQLALAGTNPLSKTVTFASLAKAKSLDTQTAAQGGDMGWERVTDASDPLLVSVFKAALQQMQKTHTKYKIVKSGAGANVVYYLIEYLGHDPKRPISAQQIQADQTTAFNTWYGPLLTKANFNPPLPAGQLGGAQVTQPTPIGGAVAPLPGNGQAL